MWKTARPISAWPSQSLISNASLLSPSLGFTGAIPAAVGRSQGLFAIARATNGSVPHAADARQQPLIYQPDGLPISAVFKIRYRSL
jgi:hypothetical protein